MTMISYAQNAEDVLLSRLFSENHKGFYIDIGAAHPTYHSVTRFFHDRGWRGINIEPVPNFFGLIEAQRPSDVNLRLAISDRPGVLTLYHAERSEGESTLSTYEANALRARGLELDCFEVEVTTLRAVCEAYVPEGTEIDFLKIDVEHHEDAVIRGADWSRWRPRVLVIEADKDTSWEPSLLALGYVHANSDGINRYYVREEDRALLPLLEKPANWLDHYIPYEHLEPRLAVEAELRATRENMARVHAELDRQVSAAASLHESLRSYQLEVDRLTSLSQDLTIDLEAERRRGEEVARSYSDLLAKVTLDDGLPPGPAMIALANRLRAHANKFPNVARRARRLFLAG